MPYRLATSQDGRNSKIRTCGPLLPRQMRYRTALYSDKYSIEHIEYYHKVFILSRIFLFFLENFSKKKRASSSILQIEKKKLLSPFLFLNFFILPLLFPCFRIYNFRSIFDMEFRILSFFSFCSIILENM